MKAGFLAAGVAVLLLGCGMPKKEGLCAVALGGSANGAIPVGGGEVVDAELRAQMMQTYARFANTCHDHEFTPEALFRRADLLRSAGKFQEAMTQLRDIHDHYANYDKRSVCAFSLVSLRRWN